MWQVNCNYKRDNTDTKCPLCQKSEDTTEHVLECEKAKKFTLSKENSKEEWKEITEVFRKNKKKRELVVIKSSMFCNDLAQSSAYTLFSHQNINFKKYHCDF